METMTLKQGRVLTLRRKGYIKVLRGAIWLTETPTTGDVILREGERYNLRCAGACIIEALTEAEMVVLPD